MTLIIFPCGDATLEKIAASWTHRGKAVNLEADNRSRDAERSYERALPFKNRLCKRRKRNVARSFSRQGEIG